MPPPAVPPIRGLRRGSTDSARGGAYRGEPNAAAKPSTAALVRLAEAGDVRAQFNAAVRLQREGEAARAAHFYELAAAQQSLKAMFNLGLLYERGAEAQGLPADPARAAELYMQAANWGDPNAQFAVAMMLKRGVGVPQNDSAALKYLRLAEAQADWPGQARAAYNIGVMYEQGRGVMRSDEEAAAYYRRAAGGARGSTKAMVNLALMMAFGRGGEQDVPGALALLESAAELGDSGAAFNLAVLQERGLGGELPRDTAAAVQNLRRAAQADHPKAMYNLGMKHLRGEGVEQSVDGALSLLGRAAERDHKAAESFARLSSRKAPGAPSEMAKARVRAAVARRRRSLETVPS